MTASTTTITAISSIVPISMRFSGSIARGSRAGSGSGRRSPRSRQSRTAETGTPRPRSEADSARLDDVDRRVDDDPHDVHEVPVDARHLDPAMLLRAVVAAEGSDRH